MDYGTFCIFKLFYQFHGVGSPIKQKQRELDLMPIVRASNCNFAVYWSGLYSWSEFYREAG